MGVSIQKESEREVIVKVSAALGWFLGAVFFLAGLIPIGIVLTGNGPMQLWLFGAIFTLVGLGLGLLSRYGTIRLSVDEDRVEFRLQALVGMKKNLNLPLDQFVDAKIETSYSSKGSNTHRVALVKEFGKPVPLTTAYSSGGHKNNERVVQAIRNLLKVAEKRREWFGKPSAR